VALNENKNNLENVEYLIETKNLCVDFMTPIGVLRAVDHLDFGIPANQITGLVGESGSGKTTFTDALLRTVSNPGEITKGEIIFEGKDIMKLSNDEVRAYKWRDIAKVFQAAQNCLNPSMSIGDQFIETYLTHNKEMNKQEILDRSAELLRGVRLDPERILRSYPHELSGGMKQRVMIAFAQILQPPVLILDEPTTALDVITQAYIFSLLTEIHKETNTTMFLSTHDIAVVAKFCDNMAVMYAGTVVEFGDVYEMFLNPKHPYTKSLIEAVPSVVGELKERVAIPGGAVNLMDLDDPGCRFYGRCANRSDKCSQVKPVKTDLGNGHYVFCHHPVGEENSVAEGGIEHEPAN